MSDQDAQDVAEEAIDKGAETAKRMTKFIPLIRDVGGGMIALTAAAISTSMAVNKFRAAYEASKKVPS